jgi:hypothetical protein
MVRLGKSIGCALLAVVGLVVCARQAGAQTATSPATSASQPGATAKAQSPKAHTHRKAVTTKDPSPAAPAPPPTLEQTPPTLPQVSFQNGELTIDAPNSTLSQVLHAVEARTGASVDIPPGEGNERVVAKLGPGPPSEVLNSLLNGSKFDYLILGVADDPGAVQKVILTVRQNGPATTAQSNPPQPSPEEPQEQPEPTENEYQNPDQPSPMHGPRRPVMPGQMPGGYQNGQQQDGARTPQQMMQQLQQMQQQQQQYQQQLNPANRGPQYPANTSPPQD